MSKTTLENSLESPLSNEKLIESVTIALGMTNQQLADELHVTRATVENWKYHDTKPSADCLRAIIGLLIDKISGMSRIIEQSAIIGRQKQEERKQKRDRRKSPSSQRVPKTSEQTPKN